MAANTLFTPQVLARTALGILQRQLILPALVNRNYEADFGPGLGATVNIPLPPAISGGGARTYTQALRDAGTEVIFDTISETTMPIVIDTHLYKGVKITDEDETMNLRDFGRQMLAPMVRVIAEGAENMIAAQMATLGSDLTIEDDGSDLHAKLIEARRLLNAANVPFDGRILLLSSEVESLLLLDPNNKLVPYTATGQSGTPALREATIGKLYGFRTIVSNSITAGTAVAFVPDAFSFVLRAPLVPDGVTYGKGIAAEGIAMRLIRDYDPRFLQDRVLVSTFAGTDTLDANRAVRITTAP